jgi:hypothetical protein
LLVTDKLGSYGAAFRQLRLTCPHERGLRKNNRAENSHQSLLEQLPHQPECRPRTAPTLNKHVEDLALVVDGAPQVHPLPSDPNDHLIEVPLRARTWAALPPAPRHRVPSVPAFRKMRVAPGTRTFTDISRNSDSRRRDPRRKSGSHLTPCWRKADSNLWYRGEQRGHVDSP